MLKTLGGKIDLTSDRLDLTKLNATVPMIESASGHYQIQLCDDAPVPEINSREVEVYAASAAGNQVEIAQGTAPPTEMAEPPAEEVFSVELQGFM